MLNKINSFINLLFLKPEDSFREIYDSINILENNVNSNYYISFKNNSLEENNKIITETNEVQKEINDIKILINDILQENQNINNKITNNIFLFSFLTLISFALTLTNLSVLFSLLLFLINFLIAYRFSYLSDSFVKTMELDKRNSKNALAELQKIDNICLNIKRNLVKDNNSNFSNDKDLELFNNAQYVLNTYIDKGIVLPMDSNTIMFLIKLLQSDLETEEVDLMKLLEMAKQNNNTIILKRTK